MRTHGPNRCGGVGPTRRPPRALAASTVALLLLAGCGLVSRPQSRPSGKQGTLIYSVGRLSFEAPADWEASGDGRRLLLVGPGGEGRIDARQVDRKFADEAQCLADADTALQRGVGQLTGVRRHPSTFAGRKALFQEADQGRWHGWAWGVCDRGEEYRIFLSAPAPVGEPTVRVMRQLSSSAGFTAR